MEYLERLDFLLNDRKKYSWGDQIGLNRGVIASMFDRGVVPKRETLLAIRRAENASPDWIASGDGRPYIVHRTISDEECAEEIRPYLEDEAWSVVLVTDHAALHVVLHQPAQHQMHPKEGDPFWVDYTLMEVFCPAGRLTLDVVRELARGPISLINLHAGLMRRIATGEVGTYRLLLAQDAWLNNAATIDKQHKVFDWPKAGDSLSKEEQALVDNFRTMCPEQKAALKTVSDALAQSVKSDGKAA